MKSTVVRRTSSRKKMRSTLGAATALIVIACLLIVMGLVLLFQLMVYFGGSQEAKNSVDASALNMAARAPEMKLSRTMINGYYDVADSTGMVGLSNINRVIGKAFLINANEENMSNNGYSSSTSSAAAQTAYQQAEMTCSSLKVLLNNKNAVDSYFQSIAQDKPAKILGTKGNVIASNNGDFATACIYRGDESNLAVTDSAAIPQGVNVQTIVQTGTTYMQGYNPSQANSKYFCFTTFHCNESPHLISTGIFNQSLKTAVNNATNPVPNAFREAGQVEGNDMLSASASAAANPMRTFNLAIPHAYLTISIQNTAQWIVQGQQYSITTYDFSTGKVWQVKNKQLRKPADGFLNGYATLGQEYQPANLFTAIQALPGDHSMVYRTMLQRVKEFMPGYTQGQLQSLLTNTSLQAGVSTYYIYPVYQSTDNSDPQVRAGTSLPSWAQPTVADGNEKEICTENAVTNGANKCWDQIVGTPPVDKHFTTETGTLSWRPGTGANQDLGDLSIKRLTVIQFTGNPQ